MSKKTGNIGSLKVSLDKPTECTFADLHDWVIWQYPRRRGGWLCGAAHPAESSFGWIPARVQPLKKRVLLYAHCDKPRATPEEAADWVATHYET